MSALNDKTDMNFLVVGVGGQGVLLASNVLAEAGLILNLDVKKSEVHGMSQRGGSVNSHVRWGPEVFSPLIGQGEVDVLVSLERLETLRYLNMLHPDSIIVADPHPIYPITVTAGKMVYPEDGAVRSWVAQVVRRVYWVPGTRLAEELGNARAANMVLIGALSALLDVPDDVWHQAMKRRVPARFLDLNFRAFEVGKSYVTQKETR